MADPVVGGSRATFIEATNLHCHALILAVRLLATVALMRVKLHAQRPGQRDIREHERRDSSVGTNLDWEIAQ